jgi:hypothetical protein
VFDSVLKAYGPEWACQEAAVSYTRTDFRELFGNGPDQVALQKYMHEFRADGDHAMCNIQNRIIPVVQLIQFQRLQIKNLKGACVLSSLQ